MRTAAVPPMQLSAQRTTDEVTTAPGTLHFSPQHSCSQMQSTAYNGSDTGNLERNASFWPFPVQLASASQVDSGRFEGALAISRDLKAGAIQPSGSIDAALASQGSSCSSSPLLRHHMPRCPCPAEATAYDRSACETEVERSIQTLVGRVALAEERAEKESARAAASAKAAAVSQAFAAAAGENVARAQEAAAAAEAHAEAEVAAAELRACMAESWAAEAHKRACLASAAVAAAEARAAAAEARLSEALAAMCAAEQEASEACDGEQMARKALICAQQDLASAKQVAAQQGQQLADAQQQVTGLALALAVLGKDRHGLAEQVAALQRQLAALAKLQQAQPFISLDTESGKLGVLSNS